MIQTLSELLATVGPSRQIVIAPYRVNPLGAHVDHQGGPVLGRSIDRYTALAFEPTDSAVNITHQGETARWRVGQTPSVSGWPRYMQAACAALQAYQPLVKGITGTVAGSLPGAGLSSSASVVLAYLVALASVNHLELGPAELVELVRQVENQHLGLNNGVQDQMCIAYGRENALAFVDSRARTVRYMPDAPQVDEVCWLLAYSGFTRELVGSGFNTRVAECREAARLLDSQAQMLGDVAVEKRATALSTLPAMLQRRARHYFSEVARVERGAMLWPQGNWAEFGRLMNQSCHSSITQYESGSPPINQLHEIVSRTTGVYGSRFCGGGYGGCVVALVARKSAETAAATIRDHYLQQYPEKAHVASVFVANPENGVQILQ